MNTMFISGPMIVATFAVLISAITIILLVNMGMKAKLTRSLEPFYKEIDALFVEIDSCLKSTSPLSAKTAKLNSRLPGLRTQVIYVASLQKTAKTKEYRRRLDNLQDFYLSSVHQLKELTFSKDNLEPIRD